MTTSPPKPLVDIPIPNTSPNRRQTVPKIHYDAPIAPPIQYATPLGTRWEKEIAAAGSASAFEYADDPKTIGPWVLGHTVGKGASGRVKIARHIRTGQLAAVKILPLQPVLSSRTSLRTQQAKLDRQRLGIDKEIVMMKLMNHPNIMRIYDVFEGEKELYLVLEYVEGGELFDFLVNRGRLPPLEALSYFKQIAYGLSYAHAFSIIHRDLKPENILIHSVDPPLIKLADWGMAAFAPPERQLETSCGSPHYASPEIVNGVKYEGTATDIWSCGVILFALLTGRLPFDDKNVRVLLNKVKAGRYDVPEFVDPLAKDLLARMLVVDVDARITMQGILAHPWMAIKTPGIPYVPAPPLCELDRPLCPEHISDELLESLRIIWGRRANVESITADLVAPPGAGSLAKAFYFLLQQHRQYTLAEHGILMDLDDEPTSHLLTPSGKPGHRIKPYAAPPVKPAVREALAKIQDQTPRLKSRPAPYDNENVLSVGAFPLARSPAPTGPRELRSRTFHNNPPHRPQSGTASSTPRRHVTQEVAGYPPPGAMYRKKRSMTLDTGAMRPITIRHLAAPPPPPPPPAPPRSGDVQHYPMSPKYKRRSQRSPDNPPRLSVDLTPAFTPRGADSKFFRNSVLMQAAATASEKTSDLKKAEEQERQLSEVLEDTSSECIMIEEVSLPSTAQPELLPQVFDSDVFLSPPDIANPLDDSALPSDTAAAAARNDSISVTLETAATASSGYENSGTSHLDASSLMTAATTIATTATTATAAATSLQQMMNDPELQRKLEAIAEQLNEIALTNREVLEWAYSHPNNGVLDLPRLGAAAVAALDLGVDVNVAPVPVPPSSTAQPQPVTGDDVLDAQDELQPRSPSKEKRNTTPATVEHQGRRRRRTVADGGPPPQPFSNNPQWMNAGSPVREDGHHYTEALAMVPENGATATSVDDKENQPTTKSSVSPRSKPKGPRSPRNGELEGLGLDIDMVDKEEYVVAEVPSPSAVKEMQMSQPQQPLVRRRTRPRPKTLDFVAGPFGPKRKSEPPVPVPTLVSPLATPSVSIKSPVVSEVKGWFSNLFNWKTQTYVLYSTRSAIETRDEAMAILRKIGMVNSVVGLAELPLTGATTTGTTASPAMKSENGGGDAALEGEIPPPLKCRVDEVNVLEGGRAGTGSASSSNLNKQVRFRVEFTLASAALAGQQTPSLPQTGYGYGGCASPPPPRSSTPVPSSMPTPTSPRAMMKGRGRKDGAAFWASPAPPVYVPQGYRCATTLVLEKGSVSAFKAVYLRLAGEWALDYCPMPVPMTIEEYEAEVDRVVSETVDGFVPL